MAYEIVAVKRVAMRKYPGFGTEIKQKSDNIVENWENLPRV